MQNAKTKWGAGVFRNPETSWHSAEGKRPGGNNVTGLDLPEVDALIAREKSLMSADARAAVYRLIDERVAAQVPYVLLWNTDERRLLYWNKFGMPKSVLGRYGDEDGVLAYWWYDEDRAAELDAAIAEEMCLPNVPLRVP